MRVSTLADVEIVQGSAWSEDLSIYLDSTRTTLKDLSGYTFAADLRLPPHRSQALLGHLSVTVVDGKLRRTLTEETSAALPLGFVHYDIKATHASVDAEVWFRGRLSITRKV